jgi:hypothetical protein
MPTRDDFERLNLDADEAVDAIALGQWRRRPELRAEFGDDLQAFLAFCRAEARGQVAASRQLGLFEPLPRTAPPAEDVDALAAAEWVVNPSIRAEFGHQLEHYRAWRRAEAAGRAKISGRRPT